MHLIIVICLEYCLLSYVLDAYWYVSIVVPCARSDLIILQTKAQAAVKTSGPSGPVVSDGVQQNMPQKVS